MSNTMAGMREYTATADAFTGKKVVDYGTVKHILVGQRF